MVGWIQVAIMTYGLRDYFDLIEVADFHILQGGVMYKKLDIKVERK